MSARSTIMAVWVALLGGLIGPASGAAAAEPSLPPGDVGAGRSVALSVCSICHVVAPNQDLPPILHPPAPNFTTIANRRSTNADSLRKFLTTTHMNLKTAKGMPGPQLTEQQTTDVIAYLLSLRRPPADKGR